MTTSQKKKLMSRVATTASVVAGVGLGALAIAKEIKKRKVEQAKQSQIAQAAHKTVLQRLKDAVSKYRSKRTPPKPSSLQMFEMY
jgi:C-terminal processing protease CtpA/Prc